MVGNYVSPTSNEIDINDSGLMCDIMYSDNDAGGYVNIEVDGNSENISENESKKDMMYPTPVVKHEQQKQKQEAQGDRIEKEKDKANENGNDNDNDGSEEKSEIKSNEQVVEAPLDDGCWYLHRTNKQKPFKLRVHGYSRKEWDVCLFYFVVFFTVYSFFSAVFDCVNMPILLVWGIFVICIRVACLFYIYVCV